MTSNEAHRASRFATTIGKEVMTMPTSKKAGKAASQVLRDPKSTKAEKRAAASDLAQRPRKKK